MHRNRHANPWDNAPPWAVDLAEMVFAVMLTTEDTRALLQKRASKLSPEDQAKVDSIFEVATSIKTKIDTAQSDEPAPGGTRKS